MKIANKLTKWEDGNQPEAYLLRFEDTMKQTGVPQQEWPQRLKPLLTSRATAYSRVVPEDAKESYPEFFKEALLNALGPVQTRHLESQKDAGKNIPRDSP